MHGEALDSSPAIQQAGNVKATFLIPDELYREVKAQTAREGRSVREVAIQLFEQWLKQKKPVVPYASPVDWLNFQAPLAGFVEDRGADHEMSAMRESIAQKWNEPS